MRSMVIISKRGNIYVADATGKFGGGYHGAHAGNTAEEAALYMQREYNRYNTSEGCDILAPAEVREALEKCKVKI